MLFCSFRDYISYHSSCEVGVLEYVYGQLPQTSLPEATNSILDECRFSVRHIKNFHIVTGLPTYSLIYILSSTSSTHHFQTVRKRPHPKSEIGESCVAEVKPYDHSSFPNHISCNQILCVGHVAIEYKHNSWFNKNDDDEMSKPSNKPLIGHPAFAGAPTFVNSIFILFRLYMTIGTKYM